MKKLKKLVSLTCACLMVALSLCMISCKDKGGSKNSNEKTYGMLLTAVSNTLDLEDYEGFTSVNSQTMATTSVIDQKKTNLGATDGDGKPWASEDAKTAYLATIETSLEDSSYSYASEEKISYDVKNLTGYEIRKSSNTEGEMNVVSSCVFKKDAAGKYYEYDVIDSEKHLVDFDFYKNAFSNGYDENLEIFASEEVKTLNGIMEFLQKDVVEEVKKECDYTIKTNVTTSKKNGVNTLTIALKVNAEPKTTSSYYGEFQNLVIEYTLVFDFNETSLLKLGITMDMTQEQIMLVNGNKDSGRVVVSSNTGIVTVTEFSNAYDASGMPTIAADQVFVDRGGMSIYLNLYVDGYEIDNAYPVVYCGDAVTTITPSNMSEIIKSNVKWYLDKECTVEFTAEKWTAYSDDINLYTKSEYVNDGYAIVGFRIYSESDYNEAVSNDSLSYYYYLYKTSGQTFTVTTYDYAYLNGTRIEKDDTITFVAGQVNYLFFIKVES